MHALHLSLKVFNAADNLPEAPEKSRPRAYIVNTDESSKLRSHWLAISTEDYKCEVFDSYGLPLNWYKPSEVVAWVYEHFGTICSNAVSLQEIDREPCGQCIYLKYKARENSMHDFASLF